MSPASQAPGSRPRRAVITGIGVLSATGSGLPAFRAGLRAGRSPVKRIDRFDPSGFRSQVAAQIDDFDPLDHMDARAARAMDRFSQFGLAVGRMAMADAGLVPGQDGAADGERIGIYLGSALGGIAFAEASTSSTSPAACAASPPPWRSRCSAGRRPRTSASRSTCAGRSSRPRTRARRARWRSARPSRRSARARSMRPSRAASRCRCRRSPSGPSTSSGRSATGTTTTRRTRPGRWTPAATGSSWARARRCW